MTTMTDNETPFVTERGKRRMAWLWFGPLVAVALLQFYLGTKTEALPDIEPIVIAPYVQAAAGHDDAALRALMWEASKPLLMTVSAVALTILFIWLVIRRWGWQRTRPMFTGLWIVVWLCVALALAARYVNRMSLTPLPPVTGTVIAAQPYPSTERGPGGAQTWLQPSSPESTGGVPLRVKIEGADFHAMTAGMRITLQRARGALWGVYVTGSDAPLAQPGQQPKPTQQPDQS
jgi:hypothetical protein